MTTPSNSAPERRFSIHTAVEVLGWAIAFYRRHFVSIVAISSVSAVARFVVVLWGSVLPPMMPAVLEILTLGARLLLLAVVFQRGLLADVRLRRLSSTDAWQRMLTFARIRWASLVVHLFVLAGAWLVFDVVPERIATRWVPDVMKSAYFATLLAVKNLTVIAFTIVWLVGVVRQMILTDSDSGYEPRAPEHPRSVEAESR